MNIARSPIRRHRNSGRPSHKAAPGYLKWLRGCVCAVGGTCAGRIEAAHVRIGTDGGTGEKPSDRYALPMCAAHHGEQHIAGERTFAKRHNIDLLATAQRHWIAWPGRIKWQREQER